MSDRRGIVCGVAAVAVMFAAAACGSTVDQTSSAPNEALDRAAGSGIAASGDEGPTGEVGTESTDVPGAAYDPVSAPRAAAPVGSAAALPGASASRAGPPGSRQRLPLKVGIMAVDEGSSQSLNDNGLGAYAPQGTTEAWKALIAHVNATGGVAGHQLTPVFAYSSSAASSSENEQAACATFTDDNTVIAVLTALGVGDTILQCLKSRGVPLLRGGPTSTDDGRLGAFPLFFEANALSLTQAAQVYVDSLAGAGFFSSKSVIGLVRWDIESAARATNQMLKPRLARYGYRLAEEVAVSYPQSSGEYGTTAAEAAAAVLAFKDANVDRVLFLDPGGFADIAFMQAAEQQGYRPRYGLSSNDAPQFLAGTVPAAQLHASIGPGWMPVFDVAPPYPRRAGRDRCFEILRRQGVAPTNASSEGQAVSQCDVTLLLQAAGARAAEPLTVRSLVAGVERVGADFRSALTFRVRYGPDRHYGADGTYRMFAFTDSCSCFRYTSEERTGS